MNKVRIIGGRWRSRYITVLDTAALRPTPNRIRETLFNWLHTDIIQATCLDLFAGSGALGFEALSRGAKAVTFIEQAPHTLKNLMRNSEDLHATGATFTRINAITWLETATPTPFDIIFLDPPYDQDLLAPSLGLLLRRGFLSTPAMIYLEHNRPLSDLDYPAPLTLIQHKKAGQVYYGLLSNPQNMEQNNA